MTGINNKIDMAVDIVLTKNGLTPEYNEATSIRFDDGDATGDFWFLQSFFEKLGVKTSETIDLYDDCCFEGDKLIRLKEELIKEINRIKNDSNKEWNVHVGTQVHPIKKEIFKPVIKKDIIIKLEKWLNITDLAIDNNEKLIGLGD